MYSYTVSAYFKEFNRRQHFFDPGASFQCFNDHSSMAAKEKRSLTVLQILKFRIPERCLIQHGCFGDSTISMLDLHRVEEKECWLVNEAIYVCETAHA